MKRTRHHLIAALTAAMLSFACTGGFVVVESGPPPYHPSHGYRHRHPHDQVVLTYHSDIAVYTVSGYRSCWYSGGRYYRLDGGVWYTTPTLSATWVVVSYDRIPPGLQKKYKQDFNTAKKNKKHKKRGHH